MYCYTQCITAHQLCPQSRLLHNKKYQIKSKKKKLVKIKFRQIKKHQTIQHTDGLETSMQIGFGPPSPPYPVQHYVSSNYEETLVTVKEAESASDSESDSGNKLTKKKIVLLDLITR